MGYKQLSVVLFIFVCHQLAFSTSTFPHLCNKHQSISLLNFKQTLTVSPFAFSWYDYNGHVKTSTWNMSRDCCLWDGVICDEFTGHVIELDLSYSNLEGKIDSNSSLFQLSYLQKLNLSGNYFYLSEISPKFGRFSSLTHLDLSNSLFKGQIPSEISHLSKLQSLYLSSNFGKLSLGPHNFKLLLQNLTQLRELDLTVVNIPSTIPPNLSFHITTLRLGSAGLYGIIPESIFHLQNLQVLDLSYNNQLSGYFPKTKWNNSASLRLLDLSGVNFFGAFLPESFAYLTSLLRLDLSSCNLSGPVPKSLWNLTRIEGPVPLFTSGLQKLEEIQLSDNNLNGAIPSWVFSLPSLSALDLSLNHFSGQLEDFKYNTLVQIYLRENQLQGPLPKSLQNLVNLETLDLTSNNFSGNVVSIFSNLKQLTYLVLSYNSISLTNDNNVNSTLPKSLIYLSLSSCEVNELDFLRSAKNLVHLDLSYNKIQGAIPDWAVLNWMHSLTYLDLSHNMLISIDHISLFFHLVTLDLRSNFLQGSLPILPSSLSTFFISNNSLSGKIPSSVCNLTSLTVLDLARNNLEGAIPQCLGNMSSQLEVLDMQRNSLSGKIPSSVCNLTSLRVLDLARNSLEGAIPQCLGNMSSQLLVLDMQRNSFSGKIPSSFCNFTSLMILDLSRNKLKGAIPQCLGNLSDNLKVLDMQHNSLSGNLQITFRVGCRLTSFNLYGSKLEGNIPKSSANCKELEVLDLGNNHLNDTFPMWLGTLPKLQVLSLRSNKLHGPIRALRMKNLFPQLQLLDLSCNAFTAELPTSLFHHFKAMMRTNETKKGPRAKYYEDSVVVVTKGLELEVERILYLYTTIDLSSNKFEGHIPSFLGDLIALRVLNLSHNGLQGDIPKSLGNLSVVESLDFSFNQLSGEIPKQLASLTSLAFLNLSHNHLQGCIPEGPQFHTFENNSYAGGNDGLRGFPVSEGCGSSRMPETNNTTRVLDEESTSEFLNDFWKAALMGYGSGLIIGLSVAYIMLSARNPNWLSWIVEELEHKITMRRRKKQRAHQRHYRRRRNNGV